MAYRLSEDDPDPAAVRAMTFVPFLPDGRCVVLPGPALPAGEVRPGEFYLLDTTMRIPMDQLGFRFQRVHPFAIDDGHLYVWLDGDVRTERPSVIATPEELAARLPVVRDAVRSFRDQTDASYYADNIRVLEPAYLRGTTPQAGSGFGGDAARWRTRRADLVRHTLVEPGGRLLVSQYAGGTTDRAAADHLRDMGFPVAGSATTDGATTAWLDKPGGGA